MKELTIFLAVAAVLTIGIFVMNLRRRKPKARLLWAIGPVIPRTAAVIGNNTGYTPNRKGDTHMGTFILQDDQQVGLSVAFVDAAGNPAKVDGKPVWSSSDETKLLVGDPQSEDGLSVTLTAVGPLTNGAPVQVSVQADADLGEGVETITGTLDVEVVGGKAKSIVITPGTPTPKA